MAINKLKILGTRNNKQTLFFEDKDTVVKVEGVYKKFCRNLKRSLLYGSVDIFRNMIGLPYDLGILRKEEFWALNDISFELKKGEVLGLIGFNGSGKSTALRLINGIFPPDKGRVIINGRIGALIAVGAGFHPYMTGRENIFLNGTILGMKKREIEQRFDSIVDFAEIEEFLDAPVSTYSSGMFVKLGFAIAIHCDPEIMLVDEVLAVGDARFQKKCLMKIKELKNQGMAFILVSHNMQNIEGFATKCILFHKGEKIFEGATNEAISRYELMSITDNAKIEQQINSINFTEGLSLVKKFAGFGTDELIIMSVKLFDEYHQPKYSFLSDDPVFIEVHLKSQLDLERIKVYMAMVNKEGVICIGTDQEVDFKQGSLILRINMPAIRLTTGEYGITFRFYDDTIDLPLTHGKYGYFIVKKRKAVLNPGINTPHYWVEPKMEIVTT